ncbi:MAG TPA: hypothetical protein VK249_00215 [Anaerolineales bacterium]|nr:hypothetical protein [Anaerolineales bacterium]
MKRKSLSIILPVFILTIVLAGCGAPPPPAPATTVPPTQAAIVPTITTTPDPCGPDQIEAEVQKVNKHMREFDDASTLASSVPRDRLGDSIADLQRIRREAEDQPIPACLTNLKTYEVVHMNTVISTLLAFMHVSDPLSIHCNDTANNPEAQALCQNIALAGQQHDQYLLEVARLLGLTVVPATPGAANTPAETPTP